MTAKMDSAALRENYARSRSSLGHGDQVRDAQAYREGKGVAGKISERAYWGVCAISSAGALCAQLVTVASSI
jgi:hypothetical protein